MQQPVIRFGVFELDPATGELRRGGVRIRVQEQPLRILQELLAHPGELVTREELRTRIWGDTFVDYDRALNTAIKKLRTALGDSAETPRYIETIAKRGYRFIPVSVDPLPRERAVAKGDRVRAISIGAVFVLIAAIAFLIARKKPPNNIHSLAVLPFVNLTGDAANDYVSDGITETLISDLGHVDSLRVISRTTAMQYKNAKKALPRIASELGVDGIIEGSVLRFGDRVRVEVKLVDAARDTLLWSAQYERTTSELDALQRDVAGDVAGQLRARIAIAKSSSAPTSESYLLYLKGRHWLAEKRNATVAAELFRESAAKDPTYAAPYAGLAEVEMFAPAKDVSPYEALVRAKAAAEKAIRLDPSNAEAHSALGMVRMFLDRDFVNAEREFRQAIALNPGAVEPHHRYGQLLAALGRFDEALREGKRATELDPFSTLVIADYGRTLYFARRFDEAVAQFQRVFAIDPNDGLAFWFLVQTYEAQNKRALVVAKMRERILADRRSVFDDAYRRGGYEAILRGWADILAEAQKNEPFVRSIAVAARYAQAGDRDRAFEWLERAYVSHTRDLVYLGVEPAFDRIRDDPRFAAMLKKVGLK